MKTAYTNTEEPMLSPLSTYEMSHFESYNKRCPDTCCVVEEPERVKYSRSFDEFMVDCLVRVIMIARVEARRLMNPV